MSLLVISDLTLRIAGRTLLDGGSIHMSARARMARIRQEAPTGYGSLLETVLAGDTARTELLAESETCADPARVADIHERLLAIDAHSAPARAAAILSGLGFDAAA